MNRLKEIINDSILYLHIQSLDRSLFNSFNSSELIPYKRFIKKGIPAYRILSLISKNYEETRDLASFSSELISIPRKERKKVDKILIYLNMTDEAMSAFIRFINSLRMRILIMNILLAMIYGIFPWLSSLKNMFSISAQFSAAAPFLPDLFSMIIYALILSLNSIFMVITFFEKSLIKKYLPLCLLVYSFMQLFLYILMSKNITVLNTI